MKVTVAKEQVRRFAERCWRNAKPDYAPVGTITAGVGMWIDIVTEELKKLGVEVEA